MSTESVTYFQHALDCGINMTGKVALAVDDCEGCVLMVEIQSPETLEVILPTGVLMDLDLIILAKSYGVDYVVVLNPNHPVFAK